MFVIATREPPPAGLAGAEPLPHPRRAQAAAAGLPDGAGRALDLVARRRRPPARNTDLAALLEPDDAVAWHSPERDRRAGWR